MKIQQEIIAPSPSSTAPGSAIHGATYKELDDANAALSAENARLRAGLKMKYFVLKPKGEDVYATASRRAMRQYAKHIKSDNPQFAHELRQWADAEWAQTENGKRLLAIGGPLNMDLDDSQATEDLIAAAHFRQVMNALQWAVEVIETNLEVKDDMRLKHAKRLLSPNHD